MKVEGRREEVSSVKEGVWKSRMDEWGEGRS